jgi:hypothetical protein
MCDQPLILFGSVGQAVIESDLRMVPVIVVSAVPMSAYSGD